MRTLTTLLGGSALLVATSGIAGTEPLAPEGMFDPYVLAEDIQVREMAPQTLPPSIGDEFDPYVVYDDINATAGRDEGQSGSLFDQWDPYFGTGKDPVIE